MKCYIILILLFCYTLTWGQNTDSLISVINNNKIEDTTKVVQYALVSRNLSSSDPEAGLLYADSALQLSLKIKSSLKLGSAYAAFAYNYTAIGSDSIAINYFEKAYHYYVQSDQLNHAARAKHNQGLNYYNLAMYAGAIDAHKTAYDIFKKTDFKAGQTQTLNSLGINFMEIGDYPRSLNYHLQSLQISQAENDSNNLCQSYMNIGLLYEKLGQYEKSLQSQSTALKISEKLGNPILLARVYNNLGNVYDLMNNPDQAITLYEKALAINTENEYTFGIASNYSNLGIVELKIGNYDSSYSMLSKAINLFDEIGDENNLAMMYNEIGDWYTEAPDDIFKKLNIPLSQRLPLALKNKKEALVLRYRINDLSGVADSHQSLSKLFQKYRQPDSALFHYEKYVIYKDSIFNDKAELTIIKNELEFEFDKQKALDQAQFNNEIKLKQAEVEKQKLMKNGFLAGLSLITLTGIFAFVSYKRRRDAIQKEEAARLLAEKTEVEMKALRAQMNPHFIFNSLNSINDFITRNNSSMASNYTIKFAKLMRMVLENSEKEEIVLRDDLIALEWYMQLEQIRTATKFQYQIDVAENINKDETLIPPLILQPFVENSIWHGFQNSSVPGYIQISISIADNKLLCVVKDNGSGRVKPTATSQNKKSMGTNITQERINLINKTNQTNYSLNYTDLPQGLKVEVILPYKTCY